MSFNAPTLGRMNKAGGPLYQDISDFFDTQPDNSVVFDALYPGDAPVGLLGGPPPEPE